MNGSNLFGLNIPNFNIPGLDTSGFMSSGQLQQNVDQGFSPQALSQQFTGQANQPWFDSSALPTPEASGGLSETLFGANGSPGWLNGGVSVLGGLANTWLGMQQYGLAKESFNFNRNLATQNYENQAQLTNRALEASLKRNAIAQGKDQNQAVSEGMAKWGIDEKIGA
tara:strand:+ start:35818 stop:36321 length:504 start_codon:yes stop_codon:yes gene_type:complete